MSSASPMRRPRQSPNSWRNCCSPLVVPTHTDPSGSGSTARTTVPDASGVSCCGVRLCSPSIVPTQMLPSRSSNRHWTALLDSPVCIVAISISGVAVPVVARIRHNPWPVVPTQRLPLESCRRRVPQPPKPVNGARSPWRRTPCTGSVIQSAPSAPSLVSREMPCATSSNDSPSRVRNTPWRVPIQRLPRISSRTLTTS